MDVARFNSAFSDARRRRDSDDDFDLAVAQQELRELIADEPEGHERAWALRMIDKLAVPPPPPPEYGPLYHEAGAIHAAAYLSEGTDEEKADALAEARHKIWAIADRAPAHEAPSIRGMTRALHHMEIMLRGHWPED
ncbi:hypothetical protein GCM10009630_47330 [Kribbella jejuensis]|uniref:Uncharacterized protein n=1 Tax=Kribbella jejuensis TaxID=236068 RepID=A0A542E702_9ACTN|nr:hypothetical protein [Kribbella jejuensis]TQJ11121.1 hypothetical protein FB475_4029 [Kribbella jejuensis]